MNNNKLSYQDKLSPDDIKEKLEEYKRVDDISKLSLDCHLRYFTINSDTGEKKFRLGGFLKKIDIDKGYIMLSNNKNNTWSVQIKNSVFFKKMSFKELKDELEESYKNEILALKKENKQLKKTLKEIKNEATKQVTNSKYK